MRGHTWPQQYVDFMMRQSGSPFWIIIGHDTDGDPLLSEKYPQQFTWEAYIR